MDLLRRTAPAVGLFFLAPLVAEFLLGNLPITLLAALVLLAPLYGGGALLIREVTRRAGRGVPTMLVLGVGYGLLEEGIATQSLFNPHYVGADLLSVGYVPVAGHRGAVDAVRADPARGGEHDRADRDGRAVRPRADRARGSGGRGWSSTAVLLVVGIVGNAAFQMANDPFRASPAQFVGAVVLAALAAVVGLRLPRRADLPGAVPPPWAIGLIGLVAGVVAELAPLSYGGVAVLAALWVGLAALAARWSVRAAWTPRHTLAAAAAALVDLRVARVPGDARSCRCRLPST